MIDQTIEERYKELPVKYREFVTSGFAADAVDVFAGDFDLTEEEQQMFENGILFLLLFIFTEDDLVNYVEVNLPLPKDSIRPIVSSIIHSLPDYAKPIILEQAVVTPASLSQQLQAEINATEHDLQSLHNIRTMAHDMQEVKTHPVVTPPTPEPVHQSSQADLLRHIETMASPNNTPRWDTEK